MARDNTSPFVALVPEKYDALTDATYDANGNMLSCKFRNGGLAGAIISTLTMTYDASGNILTAVRT